MSVLQSTQPELRYLKRKNLEQESRIIGNYYRDLIRSYGIDATYHKLDMSEFEDYKGIIDQNIILKHAYGYNISPDYTMSANMLTYMEVEQDIFQANKFGLNPNMDVNFYFDSTDFACALAIKAGQYKEYSINETTISCEIPEYKGHIEYVFDPVTQSNISTFNPDLSVITIEGKQVSIDVNAENFPYQLSNTYYCDMLSGIFEAKIEKYQFDSEQTIVCCPIKNSAFFINFPANSDLYRSLLYKIEKDDFIDAALYLNFIVTKIPINNEEYKCILSGHMSGTILFYDTNELGKYIEKIHPNVGDVIMIDFPDESNREQYEITDCFDKQLTTDGISPLLHKYIWKCKARRYVNSYEEIEENESNERLQEKLEYDSRIKEDIKKKIEFYPDNEDAAYGGYDDPIEENKDYDKQDIRNNTSQEYEYLFDGNTLDIISFGSGSKLCTDGYELIFVSKSNKAFIVAKCDHELAVTNAIFDSGLRWLKATKDQLVFVNIEGQANQLATSMNANKNELEICLNSMYDTTLDTGSINNNGNNFIKFKGCRTYILATENSLFAKLENSNTIYKLV